MSTYLPKAVQDLIDELEKLPGVGPKSAARMAYYFLKVPKLHSKKMSEVFNNLHENTVVCDQCFNVAENNPCQICGNQSRDTKKICVVEEPLDIVAFEKTGGFDGVYFVLGGVIAPADGIGPDEIRIEALVARVVADVEALGTEDQYEVILATNPNMEGEATAVYITEYFSKKPSLKDKMKVTRIARGLPTGADLEYADALTLKRALEGRTDF